MGEWMNRSIDRGTLSGANPLLKRFSRFYRFFFFGAFVIWPDFSSSASLFDLAAIFFFEGAVFQFLYFGLFFDPLLNFSSGGVLQRRLLPRFLALRRG